MAKGLYSEYCFWNPADFAEVRRHIDRERRALYLDGPNDMDWIFRNDIVRRREEAIYVDYVELDDEHHWQCPPKYGLSLVTLMPSSLKVALALHRAGFTTADALAVIAERWRVLPITDDLRWMELRQSNLETFRDLERHELLRRAPQHVYETVVNQWSFPLYPLDLSLLEVDRGALRDLQERWAPGY